MAEQIIDGIGSGNAAIVDNTHRLWICGSITSMPAVSVSATTGSESYLFAKSGAEYFPLTCTSGTDGGTLNIAGTFSATTGSEAYIKGGSIITYGVGSVYLAGGIGSVRTEGVGSVVISGTSIPPWRGIGSILLSQVGSVMISGTAQIAGSIWSMPNVSVSAGSEQWIKGGSIQTYSPLGSTFILGSIYSTGSINIATNLSSLGSWTGYVGSIWSMPNVSVSTGSESWIKGGSIQTYTPLGSTFVLGSIYTTGSVRIANLYEGSEVWLKAGSIQTYTPLGSTFVLGSVYIAGSIFFGGVGSVVVSNLPAVGSYTGMSNGSIFWGGGVGSIVISGTTPIQKRPFIYTGSLIASGGTLATGFIGSHVVSLNNEVSWISVIGSTGSTYQFKVEDSEGYPILSYMPRSGRMSYLTPFLTSGNIVFTISGAQVSGNYPLRVGYT